MQIYVNQHHRDIQDGTREHPYATVLQASEAAVPGDEIIVFPGVYRECVRPARGGTDSAHPIVYRSFLPRGAVLSGAEILTGWESMGSGLYRARIPDALFDGPSPYREDGAGGAVFRNGQPLRKAGSPEDLPKERDSWCCLPQEGAVFVWVNLGGMDPRRDMMELAVRQACFSPVSAETGYIALSEFCLEKTAGGPVRAAGQQAVLCAGCGSGWIIEDCEIRHGTGNGIRTDGQGISDPDVLLIRACEIHGCGRDGVSGRPGAGTVSVEDCSIHHCGGQNGAGIRLNDAVSLRISGCHIHHCGAGLALEHGIRDVRITGCRLHHNGSAAPPAGADLGLVSCGQAVISRNLFLSGRSCRMAGPQIDFSRNLFTGSFPEAGKDCRFSGNICFEQAEGPCSVQAGGECLTLTDARMEILGDEGRWVLRTNLYPMLPACRSDHTSPPAPGAPIQTAGTLPGPFEDGTSGAWILKPGSLP